jgi:hypothetical protein
MINKAKLENNTNKIEETKETEVTEGPEDIPVESTTQ